MNGVLSILFFGLINVRTVVVLSLSKCVMETWFLGVTHARRPICTCYSCQWPIEEAQDTHICLFSHDAVYIRWPATSHVEGTSEATTLISQQLSKDPSSLDAAMFRAAGGACSNLKATGCRYIHGRNVLARAHAVKVMQMGLLGFYSLCPQNNAIMGTVSVNVAQVWLSL
jgi:hypothetical protein